jgi:hypothetical protein
MSDTSNAPKFDLERDQELMSRIAQTIQKRLNNLEIHR